MLTFSRLIFPREIEWLHMRFKKKTVELRQQLLVYGLNLMTFIYEKCVRKITSLEYKVVQKA